MALSEGPVRHGKLAVVGLSGGVLAMIWGGVWYVALASGRIQVTTLAQVASQVVFFAGLSAAVIAFLYLWANKLSVVDGSATHEHPVLPSEVETTVVPKLESVRERV